MKTQLQAAREGILTEEIKSAAKSENLDPQILRQLIAERKVVVPFNPSHSPEKVLAVGEQTKVKVNVNLGTSKDCSDLSLELKKLQIAHECGADAVMDLSIGGNLMEVRQEVVAHSKLAVGTVPVYEAFELVHRRGGEFADLKASEFLDVIRLQAKQGVDFVTVHAGVNRDSLKRLENSKRLMGMTSRGGSLTARWMMKNKQENPLYEFYDELLDIAAEYDVTLSLGDGLRPGCIADATDRGQIEELIAIGELSDRAYEKGVQVIVEGPGHIPLDEVAMGVQLQKKLCRGAPFYVLGPVVCDIAPGYDHITAAIGGSIAALSGADFLCYVTPGEHLRLPTLEDVKEGIIAAKISAFAADLARKRPYALARNTDMAWARRNLDWNKMYELALDPQRAKEFHTSMERSSDSETCSMCGDLCAIKVFDGKD